MTTKAAQDAVLNMFHSVVMDPSKILKTPVTDLIASGVVTNFKLDANLRKLISSQFEVLDIKTLFSREELKANTVTELLEKQLLHYREVYELDTPGKFKLEVREGEVLNIKFIKGITIEELTEQVLALIYANAPIKDTDSVREIIQGYKIQFDFDRIANNEVRIALFNPDLHTFKTGDDAVRYLVYATTGSFLVVKNDKVFSEINENRHKIDTKFFEKHELLLAEVFNRFKPLILAAKVRNARNHPTNTAINRIARLSKTRHKPVFEGFNKRYFSLAVNALKENKFDHFATQTHKLSIRDKFKLLNHIEYKRCGYSEDAFVIRNGSIHIEKDRPIYSSDVFDPIVNALIGSLAEDLADLKGKKILLDAQVDYGLPISRKQTLGNLPFGTIFESNADEISAGIFWRNEWGAIDLDLSSIDIDGSRVGWGRNALFGTSNKGITFSGDVTDAETGAMEFITSQGNCSTGLFVNIYRGLDNAEFELVVGDTNQKRWISNIAIRERAKLTGRGSVIGFLDGKKFRVYMGKLNNRFTNFGERSTVLNRATTKTWTISRLFDALGIEYDTKRNREVKYDFDLSYTDFTLDKLEKILHITS